MDDLIIRQAAIDTLKVGAELLRRTLDNADIVGAERAKYEWGLGVIESYISDMEELPSAQPERKKPVFKTGESVYHVSYADGTGGFKKNKWADWTCPDCGWFVGEQYIPRRHNQQKCNYCARCGCAIDWSDADMRGEQDE